MRALEQTGEIARIAKAIGLADRAGDAPAAASLGRAGARLRAATDADATRLAEISADLRESPDRRSEPDVIVLWDDLVVVLEAKLGSANDRQTTNLWRFGRYLRRAEQWAASCADVKQSGLYELVRNWVIAWELAERTGASHAVLVNLAPAALTADVATFRALVATSPTRRVEHLRWGTLVVDPVPAWLERYAVELSLRPL